jgi:hypothetical protein
LGVTRDINCGEIRDIIEQRLTIPPFRFLLPQDIVVRVVVA